MKKVYESPELTVTFMNNSDNIALTTSTGAGTTTGLYNIRTDSTWGQLK